MAGQPPRPGMTYAVPVEGRGGHDRVADVRRRQAGAVLAQLSPDAKLTTGQRVALAGALATLALEARLADLAEVLAAGFGMAASDEDVAA